MGLIELFFNANSPERKQIANNISKRMNTEAKQQLQKDYEALDFPPGSDWGTILRELAAKHSITYSELLETIEL